MNITIAPGTYVLAVSGGVDSMVLLDVLRQQPAVKLVVAHFDHGIRPNSDMDRMLVQQTAKKHNLPFVYVEGNLGIDASEDVARKARYDFLHQVKRASNARAIVTAHHHDDVLETAIINMLRGTGRKGLTSLHSRETIHRPLLHLEKNHLRQYAQDQGLVWNEDETNTDTKYLRNHVRHNLLGRFSTEDRQKLTDIIRKTAAVNQELDQQLMHYLHVQPARDKLDRNTFIRLSHSVAKEVMASWLRSHDVRDFDQKTLDRLVLRAKTLPPGKAIDVVRNHQVAVTKQHLALKTQDR